MADEIVDVDPFPRDAFKKTVVDYPKVDESDPSYGWLTLYFASAADEIVPWGNNVEVRDRQLREFWWQEFFLAGAFRSICARDAALTWEIEGPTALIDPVTEMLHNAIAGPDVGWIPFMEHFAQNRYGQDNGAFIEIIRDPSKQAGSVFKNERAPVVGIASLDSARCKRTGNPGTPVIYYDRNERPHKLKWYEVIPTSEFPSPIESMNGVGVCAVSRVLRAAQILRAIAIYKNEKITGRFHKAIHFVSGVSKKEIQDVQRGDEYEADNAGRTSYMGPLIIASLDPEKSVSTATLDIAGLPDGFDMDEEMKWYITAIALAFGTDYQELAPLPTGNIGSGEQSAVLHRKSQGKGHALFMETLQNIFQRYGIFPRGIRFHFKERDMEEQLQQQELRTKMAEEMAINLRSGALTPNAAREIYKQRGVYDEKILDAIPEDWGEELLIPSKQNLGKVSEDTMSEDVRRQKWLKSSLNL